MDITRKTRLLALARQGHLRDVLEAYDLPMDRAELSRWTLDEACRVAGVDVDDVIVELELAESESGDWDDDDDDIEDWAYAV